MLLLGLTAADDVATCDRNGSMSSLGVGGPRPRQQQAVVSTSVVGPLGRCVATSSRRRRRPTAAYSQPAGLEWLHVSDTPRASHQSARRAFLWDLTPSQEILASVILRCRIAACDGVRFQIYPSHRSPAVCMWLEGRCTLIDPRLKTLTISPTPNTGPIEGTGRSSPRRRQSAVDRASKTLKVSSNDTHHHPIRPTAHPATAT